MVCKRVRAKSALFPQQFLRDGCGGTERERRTAVHPGGGCVIDAGILYAIHIYVLALAQQRKLDKLNKFFQLRGRQVDAQREEHVFRLSGSGAHQYIGFR